MAVSVVLPTQFCELSFPILCSRLIFMTDISFILGSTNDNGNIGNIRLGRLEHITGLTAQDCKPRMLAGLVYRSALPNRSAARPLAREANAFRVCIY